MVLRCVASFSLLVMASICYRGSSAAVAQEGSIQGLVTERESGRPLEGALVEVAGVNVRSRQTLTDRNGFYQIGGIVPGDYTLRIQHIGFLPHQQSQAVLAGERLTVSVQMEPNPLLLEGVVVVPTGGAARRELGRQRVTPGDLRLVPVPAGSGDLASYLQTLPGVVTTGDRGGQLFIRGGTPAENLVVVDGMTIYQPFHILGFFSVFPEDLVSSVDFYAGGFGARYSGRTSSILDVQMRDGSRTGYGGSGSISPFLAEVVAEGPAAAGGLSWIASARKSLIEHTSPTLLGEEQPLGFESQYVKVSSLDDESGSRCSAMGMRTSDEGRLDAEETGSKVSWENLVFGGRCVMLFERTLRLFESVFSYSSVKNSAVSRGTSEFHSTISRLHHEAHTTNLVRAIPLYAGYYAYVEHLDYDLTELFGIQRAVRAVSGIGGYAEAELKLGSRIVMRPGAALTLTPRRGVEPRLRGSWQPFGRSSEELSGAVGLYRQDVTGVSDMRDVGSVFLAWTRAPGDIPIEALHALLGWQQSLGSGVHWSLEGYYKGISDIPIPEWRATAQFNTRLSRADGEVKGADARLEYRGNRVNAFAGYGYAWTRYEAAQANFASWFGEPVQHFHPPHDRRHQVNAMFDVSLGGFSTGARWQLGSGLPYTRPIGFDDAFDFRFDLQDVSERRGVTRLVLDKPYQGRLPMMHRLDLWIERSIVLPFGTLDAQAGVINAYDRRNVFYYDIYADRRVDQLPLVPFVSITLGAP